MNWGLMLSWLAFLVIVTSPWWGLGLLAWLNDRYGSGAFWQAYHHPRKRTDWDGPEHEGVDF